MPWLLFQLGPCILMLASHPAAFSLWQRGERWVVKASARGHLVHVPALSICRHSPRVAHWETAACLANSR